MIFGAIFAGQGKLCPLRPAVKRVSLRLALSISRTP